MLWSAGVLDGIERAWQLVRYSVACTMASGDESNSVDVVTDSVFATRCNDGL